MVQTNKIVILHRHSREQIKETNAAFPFLEKLFDFDLVCLKKFNRLGHIGKLIQIPLWLVYSPLALIGRGHKVVYCDDSIPLYPLLIKLLFPWKKVIIRLGDFHSMYYLKGWLFKVVHWFEILTWKKVDDILAISQTMADYIYEKSGREVKVINDPVDTDHFKPIPQIHENKYPVVMFHGTLTANKNVDLLIETARLLPSYEFIIVGDGPERHRLEELARVKAPNMIFWGWVDYKDMPATIAQCDIGIAIRSDNPGNDYVLTSPFIQYTACGKVCISSRRKVLLDYPLQFNTAYELATKLQIPIPTDDTQYKKNIRDVALMKFDAKKIGEEIWSVLLSYL